MRDSFGASGRKRIKWFNAPIEHESLSEDEIVRQLASCTPGALLVIAGNSRNAGFLGVQARNVLYESPGSKLAVGSLRTFEIKSALIDNPFTPARALMDLVTDPLYFGYLLERDRGRIRTLLRHGNAGPETAREVARRLDLSEGRLHAAAVEETKKHIIGSPHADVELLARYAADTSTEVRLALARSTHPALLVFDLNNKVLKEIAGNRRLTETALLQLVLSQNGNVRLAAASNEALTPWVIRELMLKADEETLVELAGTLANKKLPAFENRGNDLDGLLLEMLNRRNPRVGAVIAAGSNTYGPEVIWRLAEGNPEIQALVAGRHDLSPAAIKKLYAGADANVRRRLVMNPHVALPTSEYLEAIGLSVVEVAGWRLRLAIAGRKDLSERIALELAKDPNVRVRAAIAGRKDLLLDPSGLWEIFEGFSRDPFPYVRGAAAGNPLLPGDLVHSYASAPDARLAEGLIDERGDLLEGITHSIVGRLRSGEKTVYGALSGNPKILANPEAVDKLTRSYTHHESVLEVIRTQRTDALEKFDRGDFAGACETLQRLVDCLPPFGTIFELGACLYMMRDFERARGCFRRALTEQNHIGALLALRCMERDEEVPPHLLGIEPVLLTILQNLHLARPVEDDERATLLGFIEYMHSAGPEWLSAEGPKTDGAHLRFVDMFSDSEVESIVALQLWALVDIVRQGWIRASNATGIIERLLEKFDYAPLGPEAMKSLKESLLHDVVYFSNQPLPVKKRLFDADRLHLEIFLRGGAWALMKVKEFEVYRKTTIMDNVLPHLRDDLLLSAWLELTELSRPVLFNEPVYFHRLHVIEDHGFFGNNDQALQISLPLSGGRYRFGAGDIAGVTRSEGAHCLTSGIFRNLGQFRDVDELQDRSFLVRFPRELSDPDQASGILRRYAEHDNLTLELRSLMLEVYSVDELIACLSCDARKSAIENYAIRNARTALEERLDTGPARRMVGEGLYQVFHEQPNLGIVHARLPGLMSRIEALEREMDLHPWEARVFFEGGAYLVTYDQPFPLPIPPLDGIPAMGTIRKMSGQVRSEHYSGEWLSYLLRMRVRELVRDERISFRNLECFYATAAILLSAFTLYGRISRQLHSALAAADPAEFASRARKLLCLLDPPRRPDRTRITRWGLGKVTEAVKTIVRIHPIHMKRLLGHNRILQQLGSNGPAYAIAVERGVGITGLINEGLAAEAALMSSKLVDLLDALNCPAYARQLEEAFVPVRDGEERHKLVREVREFLASRRDLEERSIDSFNSLVKVIGDLTPESVFGFVEERLIEGAAPEKAVLESVVRHTADLLFPTAKVSLAQLQEILTGYYECEYPLMKGRGCRIDLGAWGFRNTDYWKDVGKRIFTWLMRFDSIDIGAMLDRFRKDIIMSD